MINGNAPQENFRMIEEPQLVYRMMVRIMAVIERLVREQEDAELWRERYAILIESIRSRLPQFVLEAANAAFILKGEKNLMIAAAMAGIKTNKAIGDTANNIVEGTQLVTAEIATVDQLMTSYLCGRRIVKKWSENNSQEVLKELMEIPKLALMSATSLVLVVDALRDSPGKAAYDAAAASEGLSNVEVEMVKAAVIGGVMAGVSLIIGSTVEGATTLLQSGYVREHGRRVVNQVLLGLQHTAAALNHAVAPSAAVVATDNNDDLEAGIDRRVYPIVEEGEDEPTNSPQDPSSSSVNERNNDSGRDQ